MVSVIVVLHQCRNKPEKFVFMIKQVIILESPQNSIELRNKDWAGHTFQGA